ncbi:MAG: carboxypeptidase regulatory-like domain-containing protein, partial [Dehalococcoidia bacterium]
WGGMQDWNYLFMGCNDVTIEVSNSDQPPTSQIPILWNENRDSMLAYIETALIGVRGVVTDADTGVHLAATVAVAGRDHDLQTDPDVGDYHRMLLPGTYDLTFQASGYETRFFTNVVVAEGDATRLEVTMSLPAQVVSPNGGEELTVGEEAIVTWTGHPEARFQVQYTPDYGATGTITDDFEGGVLDPAYTTGGDAPWSLTRTEALSGYWSARAGAISNDEVSWLTRTAAGGDSSFWYKVSSEADGDFFNFYIDGDLEIHASGTAGPWTYYSTTLSPGSHELKWEYAKDGSSIDGDDTVWIDDLEMRQEAIAWADIITLTDPGATSTPWIPAESGGAFKVRVRSYYEESGYGAWDESDATFAVVDAQCLSGDTNEDSELTVGGDVPAFVELLLGTGGGSDYQRCAADVNADGAIDGRDAQGFVNLFRP